MQQQQGRVVSGRRAAGPEYAETVYRCDEEEEEQEEGARPRANG